MNRISAQSHTKEKVLLNNLVDFRYRRTLSLDNPQAPTGLAWVRVAHSYNQRNLLISTTEHSRDRKKGGLKMTEKHTGKDIRRNAPKGNPSGQPEPLSGSKKVKKRNQVSQTNGEG